MFFSLGMKNKMKIILTITCLVCLLKYDLVSGQHLYVGVNGGINEAAVYTAYNSSRSSSIEGKIGWASKNTKWQFETSYQYIDMSSWREPYIYSMRTIPLIAKYNLPFIFLQGGYKSLLWKKNEIVPDPFGPGYYYLEEREAVYYNPAFTLGFGLEKNISETWKINMQVNFLHSITSLNEYHDYRAARFRDYNFLVGINYYFKKFGKVKSNPEGAQPLNKMKAS
jgi:hypothetical protein